MRIGEDFEVLYSVFVSSDLLEGDFVVEVLLAGPLAVRFRYAIPSGAKSRGFAYFGPRFRSAIVEMGMGVDAEKQRMRFREEVWKLLRKKTHREPSEILRAEVEVIGASLGLAEEEACREFLGLWGVLWDVRSGDPFASMVASARGEGPPRNWFAFVDVYLL